MQSGGNGNKDRTAKAGASKAIERKRREAEALKRNLAKRKAQFRARRGGDVKNAT